MAEPTQMQPQNNPLMQAINVIKNFVDSKNDPAVTEAFKALIQALAGPQAQPAPAPVANKPEPRPMPVQRDMNQTRGSVPVM